MTTLRTRRIGLQGLLCWPAHSCPSRGHEPRSLSVAVASQDFMIQMGDPTGTGKGGESIWGGKFEDEISAELKVRVTSASTTSVFPSVKSVCYARMAANDV